jgi:flagellar basal-body rod protein FlgG
MTSGLRVAARAMANCASQHDVIAHNLANVSTPGVARQETFVQALAAASGGEITAPEVITRTNFTPGPPVVTGNILDLSLEGSGFFTINTDAGVRYTRDGAFRVDSEGLLRSRAGHLVLGENGALFVGDRRVTIEKDGSVFAGDVLLDRLKLTTFASGEQLEREGGGLYLAKPGMRPTDALPRPIVHSGQIEGSAVEPVTELVRMIEALRSYEAAARVVTATDATLSRAVNDIARI